MNTLTTTKVKSNNSGKLFSSLVGRYIVGDAHLYVSAISINRATENVAFVAVNNGVDGFNLDNSIARP